MNAVQRICRQGHVTMGKGWTLCWTLDEEFFTEQLWFLGVKTCKPFLPDAATGTTASTFCLFPHLRTNSTILSLPSCCVTLIKYS